MGGDGSIRTWARRGLAARDLVHLSRAGYERLAEGLVDRLLRAYDARERPEERAPVSLAEPVYLLFLAAAVLAVRLVGNRAPRAFVLVPLSLVFYATWNPLALLPLLATAAVDFNVARALGRTGQPGAPARCSSGRASSSTSALLAAFKYSGLLARAAAPLLGRAGDAAWPPFTLVLAAGISFYTFQSLGCVVDVYRRDEEPPGRFLDYLAFVSFFPTLLAGPITRAETFFPQAARPLAPLSDADGSRALFRIGLGLAKKCLIADVLAVNLVDRVFEVPGLFSLGGGGGRGLRLRGPDLGRLLRLQRHRHRLGAPPRLPPEGELRLALPGGRPRRVLATLAHLALDLAARLPLLLAAGEPARRGSALREPRRHVRPRRPLARDDLGLRRVGARPRRRPRGPEVRRVAPAAPGGPSAGVAARPRSPRDVPLRVVRVDPLPLRERPGCARLPSGPRRRDAASRERPLRRGRRPRRRPRRPFPPVVLARRGRAPLLPSFPRWRRRGSSSPRSLRSASRPGRPSPRSSTSGSEDDGGCGADAPEDPGDGAPRRARRGGPLLRSGCVALPARLVRGARPRRGRLLGATARPDREAERVVSPRGPLPGRGIGPAGDGIARARASHRSRSALASGPAPAVPIEDPSDELGRFFARLGCLGNEGTDPLVRVTHFGDSPTDGGPHLRRGA